MKNKWRFFERLNNIKIRLLVLYLDGSTKQMTGDRGFIKVKYISE